MEQLMYWSMNELMTEFHRRASKSALGKTRHYDADEALRLMVDERFDPAHFTMYIGLVRGFMSHTPNL